MTLSESRCVGMQRFLGDQEAMNCIAGECQLRRIVADSRIDISSVTTGMRRLIAIEMLSAPSTARCGLWTD